MAGGTPGRVALVREVLARIVDRFAAMPPNGIDPPATGEAIQLRIGTLVAATTWAEIAELTGVPDVQGEVAVIEVAFAAVEAAVRDRHALTRRLMVRIRTEPDLVERLVDRLRPGGRRRGRGEWIVLGPGAERWTEEP